MKPTSTDALVLIEEADRLLALARKMLSREGDGDSGYRTYVANGTLVSLDAAKEDLLDAASTIRTGEKDSLPVYDRSEEPDDPSTLIRGNMGGWDWSILLVDHPELADRCEWDKLDGRAWANLLLSRPGFAFRCDWDKLATRDLRTLLGTWPEFETHPAFVGKGMKRNEIDAAEFFELDQIDDGNEKK